LKHSIIIGLIGAVLTFTSTTAQAQDPSAFPTARATKDLAVDDYTNVYLVVEGIPPKNAAKLSTEVVRTRIELRLRAAGLRPVFDMGPRPNFLYVNVNILKDAFHISVHFKRPVKWELASRDPVVGLATTWNKSVLGPNLDFKVNESIAVAPDSEVT
jgi:hypothetical protein